MPQIIGGTNKHESIKRHFKLIKMEESELVDKYLRGELSVKQQEDFIKQIQVDDNLKKRISLRRLIIEGISHAYTDKLKQELMDFDKSLDGKTRFRFSWKMAAVFVFLILASSITYLSIKPTNPYDFDITEPGLPNSMGTANNIKFNNAMNNFKQGDYLTSGQVFNLMLFTKPSNDTLLYFSGLCDFRNHQIKQAVQKLSKVNAESVFYEKAVYALALAYWANNDSVNAIELLNKIKSDKSNSFQQQAEKALEAIN